MSVRETAAQKHRRHHRTATERGPGGTGITTVAVLRQLHQNHINLSSVELFDGLQDMLDIAEPKVISLFNHAPPIHPLIVDVFSGQLATTYPHRVSTYNLITAQRVFGSCRRSRQVTILNDWLSLLQPGGTIVLDIQHPERIPLAFFVVALSRLGGQGIPWDDGITLADPTVFAECRAYATTLARNQILTWSH
ncbi:MAG: hypothetical protein Q9169_000164 [Polycauliona sp. 2 TL-2023]